MNATKNYRKVIFNPDFPLGQEKNNAGQFDGFFAEILGQSSCYWPKQFFK